MDKTLESFNNDELASSVFLKKYALRDDNNNILEYTLEETKDRLVKGILEVDDKKYENSFKELLNYFMPGGRIVYALGNKYANNATFSNCYVLDSPNDNLESIFGTAANQARIFSRGGGVGLDISKLRPNNSKVNNVAKTSTGAV
jgi:ribonucleoside-diphosphate reductase alpha chain